MPSLLSERAVLVRPTISVWRGEITDRAAAATTAAHHNADRTALRTTKYLVPKEAIDPILTEAGCIRAFVRAETLPWRWDGVGLLPTENYFPFVEGWHDRLRAFDGEVHQFLDNLTLHIAAGRRALGSLAPTTYPTRDELATRFSARIEVIPVPDADDFRAQVTDAEAEAIRESLREAADAQLAQAQSFLWEQMSEHVGHIAERLSAYGRDPDSGRIVGQFRDTMIGNLRLLCDRLARLNINHDPAIEAMRQRLVANLCPHEPDDLRSDEGLRASVRDEAARIIEEMAAVYGPVKQAVQ